MWGGDDPDERKPLWWKEYQFAPETRTNIQSGPKTYDSIGFNDQMFDYYRKLINIRKENPVLSNGRFGLIKAEGNTLAYRRFDDSGSVIVLINAGDMTVTYNLNEGKEWTDLLTGSELKAGMIEILPMSALILRPE